MAKVFLEGIQRLDFDTKDGNHIDGYKLHVTLHDPHVIGKKTDTKFINSEAWKNLGFSLDEISTLVQHEVELETNLDGKVVGINPI